MSNIIYLDRDVLQHLSTAVIENKNSNDFPSHSNVFNYIHFISDEVYITRNVLDELETLSITPRHKLVRIFSNDTSFWSENEGYNVSGTVGTLQLFLGAGYISVGEYVNSIYALDSKNIFTAEVSTQYALGNFTFNKTLGYGVIPIKIVVTDSGYIVIDGQGNSVPALYGTKLNFDQRGTLFGQTDPRCFPAVTPITLADGTDAAIETITPDTMVLAVNDAGSLGRGTLEPCRVVRTFKNITDEWVKISYTNSAGHAVSFEVTPGHDFINELGQWEKIEAIAARDGQLVLEDGDLTH